MRILKFVAKPICGHHQLASAKKFKLADAQVVASHPQALGQCGKWLDANLPNAKRDHLVRLESAKLSKTQQKALCIVSSLAIEKYSCIITKKILKIFLLTTLDF